MRRRPRAASQGRRSSTRNRKSTKKKRSVAWTDVATCPSQAPRMWRPPRRYSVAPRSGAPPSRATARSDTWTITEPDDAEDDADQEVTAEERIAQASGEQPAPRDDGLRPMAPDVGLDRKVERPHQRRAEKGIAHRDQEQAEAIGAGHEVRLAQPQQDVVAEDERAQPERAAPVAAAADVVAEGQEDPAEEHGAAHDGDQHRPGCRFESRLPRTACVRASSRDR